MSGHFRTEEEAGAEDGMTLDEFVIDNREATFVVRMKGDALRARGILHGDMLVVDRSRSPRAADIALAVEDGAFIVRAMSDLEEGADAKVEAVVTAVVRKLV